jgi:hypothetical protein
MYENIGNKAIVKLPFCIPEGGLICCLTLSISAYMKKTTGPAVLEKSMHVRIHTYIHT